MVMPVFCQNCGKENKDPGGNLQGYHCGFCGKGPLKRVPKEHVEGGGIIGAGIGAALGAGVGGPVGAIIGALFGYFLGEEAGKRP
jgi:hypothetical protein